MFRYLVHRNKSRRRISSKALGVSIYLLQLSIDFVPPIILVMDLDGNGNHGLQDLWGEDEEKFDIPDMPSPPPMRSTGFLLLLTSGLAGQVHLFQHSGVCS